MRQSLNDLQRWRNCYTSAAAIIKKLDDDYSPDRAVKEYIKKIWLNYLRNEYSNNKNFEKRSQITKDANLLKQIFEKNYSKITRGYVMCRTKFWSDDHRMKLENHS